MNPPRHVPILWWLVFWASAGVVFYLLARPWIVTEWRKLKGLLL